MEYIGIDVHKRESHACILDEGDKVVLDQASAQVSGEGNCWASV